MANMLMFETNKYAIKIDNFEGPLDLLCHLIDKNKMDIYDIKINEIADQYIEYLNQMEEMNLDIASEFLIMASTLIYLKSKSLLPKQDEVEEELTEEELIQRIIEYTKYKEIIKKLRVNYEENSKSFFKMPEQIELPKKQIEKDYDKDLIPNLYKTLWNKNKEKINKNAENIQKIAITESYTVTSKVKEMFKALIKNNKFVFNKLFSIEEHNKQEVVTAFSGLLEMSKRDKVNTKQEDLFEDIIVEKKKKIV
ncbi:MAG TPA: segregation/condensation protein A [Clostridiaceae bacterium]|nr:segregation/condensation protein A [Clostridiaceae bacterium]